MDELESARRDIAVGMVTLARQMKRRFDLAVEEIGVTSAKWTLIAVVSRNPGATQRTIAETLNVTEASAGRLVDRLCADGYLRRSANPQDRRAYRVFLTDAADPLLARLEGIASVNEADAFAGLSHDDLKQFRKFLDVAQQNLADTGPLSQSPSESARALEPVSKT